MKPNELLQEIEKLDLSEKLMLVEEIWDSIALNHSEVPLPKWQKDELDKRYNEYKSGELPLHEWNVVHEELRKKYS